VEPRGLIPRPSMTNFCCTEMGFLCLCTITNNRECVTNKLRITNLIILDKFMKKEENDLEILRHSMSHVLAAAVKELWPNVKFAIGPAIDDGFYYDFDFGEEKVGEDDFKKIEKKMNHIIKQNKKFEMSTMAINEAISKTREEKQKYKIELIEDLKKDGESEVSYYKIGDFEDLCCGPHIESSGKIKKGSFKLTKIAGAYWRGDENREMLVRIYGTAFSDKKELDEYLKMLEEAKKRDHRIIGKQLDLFSMHEEAPGMPFFHPKGAIIYNELRKFWVDSQAEFRYDTVFCPSMLDVELWKKSGHWDHYKDDMYFVNSGEKGRQFALRPMDCPGAILVYNNSPKSYRDLPLRYAEPGLITRKEKSGQLGGLLRVQQFRQDDAHLFITNDQVKEEINNIIALVEKMYKPFGLEYRAYLSTKPDDSMGDVSLWNKAEAELKEILDEKYGDSYGIKEKDGAFYGPKIDFQLKDCIGRTWQCATIQLDFQMPLKFDCKYIEKNGKEVTPVMIHRTILGSFERFMGILIEHYAGAFPVWLSPVQVKLVAVSEKHVEYCEKIEDEFLEKNIRVEIDASDETVGNKIRKAVGEKVPYMLVIGDKEMKSKNLMVRDRGEREAREVSRDDFVEEVLGKIKNRS
jgi:threonyl-tRNA synthetase